MGTASGKNKTSALNDSKERAAGRGDQNPQLNPALDPDNTVPAKGETGGAFGREGHAHRNTDTTGGGGGGGGGQNSLSHVEGAGARAAEKLH
ncbi:MAG TPA: hypothetical protein VF624_19290 [Tepidisphaeraceae bacterium]|jgi:hypothetical protein